MACMSTNSAQNSNKKGVRKVDDFKKELLAMSKEECAERIGGARAFIRYSVIKGNIKIPDMTDNETKQFFNEFCLHMQSALTIAEELVCRTDDESFSKAIEKVISNSEEWVAPFRL